MQCQKIDKRVRLFESCIAMCVLNHYYQRHHESSYFLSREKKQVTFQVEFVQLLTSCMLVHLSTEPSNNLHVVGYNRQLVNREFAIMPPQLSQLVHRMILTNIERRCDRLLRIPPEHKHDGRSKERPTSSLVCFSIKLKLIQARLTNLSNLRTLSPLLPCPNRYGSLTLPHHTLFQTIQTPSLNPNTRNGHKCSHNSGFNLVVARQNFDITRMKSC